jgi:hypothetical protein
VDSCFASDSMVTRVENDSNSFANVRVDSLKTGDTVVSVDPVSRKQLHSKVFYHRVLERTREMVSLEFNHSIGSNENGILTCTKDHLVYVFDIFGGHKIIQAQEVQVGDLLLVNAGNVIFSLGSKTKGFCILEFEFQL